MFKNSIRVFSALIIIIVFCISYLSVFGIKTNKFNEMIKSQVSKQDSRLDIELQDVFIKLNIKEKSFSINSKDIKFFILREKQDIANVDILISVGSLIRQDKKIKKIIINSKENEISDLLKFIRTYKINIPTLYAENSVTKGKIIYDIVVNSQDNDLDKIEIIGKIIDTNLNILGKEKLKNINLKFNYKNKNLKIKNLQLSYKKNKFSSEYIDVNKMDDDKLID